MDLCHSCTRPPCHPYSKMDSPIRAHLSPCHPYVIMDGFMKFFHATAMPPMRQNGRTSKSITTSMPPHTEKWMDLSILARDRNAIRTPKWTGTIRTSLPPGQHTPKWVDLCHSCIRKDITVTGRGGPYGSETSRPIRY
jgi:hypothetical protein